MNDGEALLKVSGLRVIYRSPGKKTVEAVKGVSFSIRKGEALGIVGESGCGKTSTAKVLTGLEPGSSGEIFFKGTRYSADGRLRLDGVQMVFQDAAGSLNPRMTIGSALREALKVHRVLPHGKIDGRISQLLEMTGLSDKVLGQYPGELSGGQCQRVSIARCLSLEPELLIADEPVSALDVSVQARILNLLKDLRKKLNLSILMISHDLAVVRMVCDRICVMHEGNFVECGDAVEVLEHPKHPYTRELLAAVPRV